MSGLLRGTLFISQCIKKSQFEGHVLSYNGQKDEERDGFCSHIYCSGIASLHDANGSDGLYTALPNKNSNMIILKFKTEKQMFKSR
jgi:hypothetical protein